jgi:Uncharacterized conserved protein
LKPAEAYILKQKEPFRDILLQLQIVIEATIPNAVLLYKWGLPFYYIEGKQPFCYLNCTKRYVDLVFWHGAHLTIHLDLLVGGRKHFKSLRYNASEALDEEIVINLLHEAYSVRDRKYYK